MSKVQNELASLNAIGNGAITGSMNNAGQDTGLQAGPGADIGMDAINRMGGISDEESGSTESFEVHEESYDFTATKSSPTSPGRMGAMDVGATGDSLSSINSNNFKL